MQDLITKVQAGDRTAFEALLARYQNMAFSCALSRLGDFHLAEDAVQEASIAAYHGIGSLVDAAAFGAWFRSIVVHQCSHVLRRRRFTLMSMEDAEGMVSTADRPDVLVERAYEVDVMMDAVSALPEEHREVVLLFYLSERSQREVADLLDIPVATVNNRLHAARRTLKRRTVAMLKDNLSERKLGGDFVARIGEIVKVRGAIIDVRLDNDGTDALDSVKVLDGDASATFAVAQRLGGGLVRCVPVTPKGLGTATGEFKNGVVVSTADVDIMEEVSANDIARVVDVFAAPRVRKPAIVETGIKVIDLFCPLTAGGTVALFGLAGVGKAVVLGELTRRLAANDDGLAIIGLGKRTERTLGQESIRNDKEMFGLVDRTGNIDVAHLVTDLAANPDYATANDVFDASIYCSVELAAKNVWPAVDPLVSRAKALTAEIVGQAHVDVSGRACEALARAAEIMVDPVFLRYLAHGSHNLAASRAEQWFATRIAELGDGDRTLVMRARKIELFMSQPMMVAEPYTKKPGRHVPLTETLQAVVDILDGKYDLVEAEAFRFKSGIDEVVAAA